LPARTQFPGIWLLASFAAWSLPPLSRPDVSRDLSDGALS
jgi:hypothetical protein